MCACLELLWNRLGLMSRFDLPVMYKCAQGVAGTIMHGHAVGATILVNLERHWLDLQDTQLCTPMNEMTP